MFAIFAIVFTASLVGIVKPYIPNSKRAHFVIAAVVSFILFSATAPASSNKDSDAAGGSNASEAADANWSYSEDKDQMRGAVTKFATSKSENKIDLDFPYGEVYGEITIRKRKTDGLNIMFSVDEGQILCRGYGGDTYVSVKFDGGPIKRFNCTGASDGTSDTAFITNEAGFLKQIKNAKTTMIEAEFYQNGRQQFTFNTAGLKWD